MGYPRSRIRAEVACRTMRSEAPRPGRGPMGSVLSFALTGAIGLVRPGISEDEIQRSWGPPSQLRLTRPPSRSYGPVMVFLRDGLVTHMGIYFRNRGNGDEPLPGSNQLVYDLDGRTLIDEFRQRVDQAGSHCDLARDVMYDGEPEVVLRIQESAVTAVFDEAGRLSCLESEPDAPTNIDGVRS
jgi:hypothetical protein